MLESKQPALLDGYFRAALKESLSYAKARADECQLGMWPYSLTEESALPQLPCSRHTVTVAPKHADGATRSSRVHRPSA